MNMAIMLTRSLCWLLVVTFLLATNVLGSFVRDDFPRRRSSFSRMRHCRRRPTAGGRSAPSCLFLADVPRESERYQHPPAPPVVEKEEESEAAYGERMYRQRRVRRAQSQDWTFPHAIMTVNLLLAVWLFAAVRFGGGTPAVMGVEQDDRSCANPGVVELHQPQQQATAKPPLSSTGSRDFAGIKPTLYNSAVSAATQFRNNP